MEYAFHKELISGVKVQIMHGKHIHKPAIIDRRLGSNYDSAAKVIIYGDKIKKDLHCKHLREIDNNVYESLCRDIDSKSELEKISDGGNVTEFITTQQDISHATIQFDNTHKRIAFYLKEKEVLSLEDNGHILLHGKLIENDKQVVEGLRDFLKGVSRI